MGGVWDGNMLHSRSLSDVTSDIQPHIHGSERFVREVFGAHTLHPLLYWVWSVWEKSESSLHEMYQIVTIKMLWNKFLLDWDSKNLLVIMSEKAHRK